MRTVSQKQKDKAGTRCFICGKLGEQHHPLIYAGRQIDKITIPVCVYHHRGDSGEIFRDVRLKAEFIVIHNNLEYLKTNYKKANWQQRYDYLKGKPEINSDDIQIYLQG
jgi:hypothetical protein